MSNYVSQFYDSKVGPGAYITSCLNSLSLANEGPDLNNERKATSIGIIKAVYAKSE